MADLPIAQAGDRLVYLRPMGESDLEIVESWLRAPHVARWWLAHSSFETEFGSIRARMLGEADLATHMLIVTEHDRPIGWAQWYRWADYPTESAAIGALPGEVGIDYAIGDPAAVGRHVGTEMIAALVRHVRLGHPNAGILIGPAAENLPSRRVLERNGFQLVAVRPVSTETTNAPIAIYRLTPTPIRLATQADAGSSASLLDQFNQE